MTQRPGKRFKPIGTDSRHNYGYHLNLLKSHDAPTACNQVWVADTTYIRVEGGFVYLATVMDLYNREIVGWSISSQNDTSLVIEALTNAFHNRGGSRAGLVHHSDRGSTYASQAYQKVLLEHGVKPSMSAKGNCYDTATMESFFGRDVSRGSKPASLKIKHIKMKPKSETLCLNTLKSFIIDSESTQHLLPISHRIRSMETTTRTKPDEISSLS